MPGLLSAPLIDIQALYTKWHSLGLEPKHVLLETWNCLSIIYNSQTIQML